MTRNLRFPPLDWINSIVAEESRFRHTARHLYCEAERWDLCTRGLQPGRRHQVVHCGRDAEEMDSEHPQFFRASAECRKEVLEDHDCVYRPAYMAAVKTGHVNEDRCLQGDGSLLYVGRDGVVVIIRYRQRGVMPFAVSTAYRPLAPVDHGRPVTNEDFYRAAVRKLRDRASIQREDP